MESLTPTTLEELQKSFDREAGKMQTTMESILKGLTDAGDDVETLAKVCKSSREQLLEGYHSIDAIGIRQVEPLTKSDDVEVRAIASSILLSVEEMKMRILQQIEQVQEILFKVR